MADTKITQDTPKAASKDDKKTPGDRHLSPEELDKVNGGLVLKLNPQPLPP
jgi:hypothetical protein